MRTVSLGKTDLQVSAMGIGAMRLSLKGRPSREQGIEVVQAALDRGVTFFDTADAYCKDASEKHHNERLLREALDAYEGDTSDVVVATKGGLMRPEGRWERNGDPEHLRRTIRESFEALGGEQPITLWQHHAPDSDVPVTDSLQAAREAQEEGLIQWVGVSNYTVEELEAAREVVEIVSVQNQYNPWHRKPEREGVLEYCTEEGLTFLPWGPLGGKERAKEMDAYPALREIAQQKERSPQQVVLAWLMSRSSQVLPIPGVRRIETLTDSLAAIDLELTPEEADRITREVD